MLTRLLQFINRINSIKLYLIVASFLLNVFLIVFSNLGYLPFRLGDFIFISLLVLGFSLYRPGWAYLIFISTVPLEIINLAPTNFGINIRAYQLLGSMIILALAIRYFSGRLNFDIFRFRWYDFLPIAILGASFMSLVFSYDSGVSLKLVVILFSFVLFYFLTRVFVRSEEDIKKVLPFVLVSGGVVVLYGIWQNWRFQHGLSNFEIMPGRPNAVFLEPDWLGMYLVGLLCILLVMLFQAFYRKKEVTTEQSKIENLRLLFLFGYLVLVFTLLVVVVARSAWLGALAALFIYLFSVLTNLRFRSWEWEMFLKQSAFIFLAGAVSFLSVFVFNLTNFQLGNRIESAGTGLQEITISCEPHSADSSEWPAAPIEKPLVVDDIKELEKYRCRHIKLEEINAETDKGNFITVALRKDPNFDIREKIYKQSWSEIKKHPIVGIGWGSIRSILGFDERGASLNASNIFLEIWLGSGILGVVSFVVMLGYIFFLAVKKFFYSPSIREKSVGLFFLISLIGFGVFNFFNAGIMLGFLWIWLGMMGALIDKK